MSRSPVVVEKLDHITVVRLNRPERKNAIDRPTAEALHQAFEEFDSDTMARVAVLTGAEGVFCSGADLKAVSNPETRNNIDSDGAGPLGPTRMQLSKPVIAAIEGYAVAGGLELALWCDMRIASSNAVFGVFCRRWGVPLIDGGTVRLPRIIGQGRAMDMILTGRSVNAEEALSWGLANRIVEEGKALNEALELAQQIAGFSQECMKADRLSAYNQWNWPLERALREEGCSASQVLEQEGVAGAMRFSNGAGRHGSFE
ncbi:crotonase/enoyl-CoA hydratase family protein [Parendozoicomonas sp. Alg238-R29]|uniref:crotonase/enoyl-CoA hydratase family protein n=1 Tax=Parendozoicomonas sp. Alg238-R29 TaxID=2993446 RepID=UPI00248E4557|nr:crotonase/enoyl-CoA hydratase family protein [Parendozoicomonas sp. Alg238-R29]